MNGERNLLPTMDSPANPAGFDGRVRCTNLADLVQFQCLANARVAVCVRSGPHDGHLFFERGELIHAATGKLTGRAAAFEILSWESGSFWPSTAGWPARRTLELPWQTLLMLAAQQRDEMLRDRASAGPASGISGLMPRQALRAPEKRGHTEGAVRTLAPPKTVVRDSNPPEGPDAGAAPASAVRISRRGDVIGVKGEGKKLVGIGRDVRIIGDALAMHLGLESFSGLEAELSSVQLLFFADTEDTDVVTTAPHGASPLGMRRVFGGA